MYKLFINSKEKPKKNIINANLIKTKIQKILLFKYYFFLKTKKYKNILLSSN